MKNINKIRNVCVPVAIAAVLIVVGVTSADAHRCRGLIECGHSTAKTISKDVTKDAEEAKEFANDSANVTKAEADTMKSESVSAYAGTRGAVNNAAIDAKNKLKDVYNAAMLGAWKKVAENEMSNAKTFANGMKSRAQILDNDAKAALNRIKHDLSRQTIDEQTRTDMQTLVKAIVYADHKIPAGIRNSSFGIEICFTVGGAVVGGGECTTMLIQLQMENGKFPVAIVQSIGLGGGPTLGANVAFGVVWHPELIDEVTAPYVGLDGDVDLVEGGGLSVDWKIPTTKVPADPKGLIPGFAITIGAGAKVDLELTASYSKVVGKLN